MSVQFLRETTKNQIGNISPFYNITFNQLRYLYRKVIQRGKLSEALADAFIFGYAMGVQATEWELKELKNILEKERAAKNNGSG